MSLIKTMTANRPAAGKAGIAPLFATGHPGPVLPEPGRQIVLQSVFWGDFRNLVRDS